MILQWFQPSPPLALEWIGPVGNLLPGSPLPAVPLTAAIIGPRGAQGVGGAARYEHTQGSPSAAWVINHGLGFYPSVTLLTAGGLEFEGLVLNTSLNQVSVQLNQAQAGRAILQ